MRKPVGLTAPYRKDDDDDIQDYKKPWVGLTDEEIVGCAEGLIVGGLEFARAIEEALRRKNT